MSEENFPELDFAKIKSDLVSQDETKRALIIQALRWVYIIIIYPDIQYIKS